MGELAGTSFAGGRLGLVNWRKWLLGALRSATFSRRPRSLQWHPTGRQEDARTASDCIAERCAPESTLHPKLPRHPPRPSDSLSMLDRLHAGVFPAGLPRCIWSVQELTPCAGNPPVRVRHPRRALTTLPIRACAPVSVPPWALLTVGEPPEYGNSRTCLSVRVKLIRENRTCDKAENRQA